MAGQHISLALAIPRATRPPGRYVSLHLGPYVGPIVTLSAGPLPGGQATVAYVGATITASGGAGPYSFEVYGGTFPPGMTLSTGGEIGGTPTTDGLFSFDVRGTDSTVPGLGGPFSATRTYTITIAAAPVPPFRGLIGAVGMSWTMRLTHESATVASWNQSRLHWSQISAGWARSAAIDRILAMRWGQIPTKDSATTLPWDRMAARQQAVGVDWNHAAAHDIASGLPWSMRDPRTLGIGSPWHSPPPVDISAEVPWDMREALSRALGSPWSSPPYKHHEYLLPWKQGTPAPWLITPPVIVPPPPPPPGPTSGRHVSLRFACPRRTESTRYLSLPFSPWQCYIGRISPRIITVTNTVTIVRTPDNAPVHATACTIRGDLDSPLWTIQLTIGDAASLDLLRPGPSGAPRTIRATINGHAWVFQIEQFAEAARFGSIQRTASGRSTVALLTRDYAPARTRMQTAARNADQLVDEELDGTGFSADWNGPTWLVPGGLWSYADLAPLDALRTIAEACGCVLQAHQTDPVVRIIPAFRARPWKWSITAPDVDIVDDYVLERSIGSAQGIRHNAVEVRGEVSGGIRGEVKIAGTDGAIALPQVTHPLITAYAAAESRGIYELSRVGPIGRVTIELPLFPPTTEPGLVLPGMLARLSGTLMTRAMAVSIGSTWSAEGGLYVRQSLELERHYDA